MRISSSRPTTGSISPARARGQIAAVLLERRAAGRCGRKRAGGLAGHRATEVGPVIRRIGRLRRAVDPRGQHLAEVLDRDLAERRRDRQQHTAQLGRPDERGDEPCATDPPVAEIQRGQHPCALDGRFDVVGKIADRTRAGRQRGQRAQHVPIEHVGVEVAVPDDPLQVAVGRLQQLVQPMHQLDVGVAAQLAESRGGFDASE